MLNLNIICNGDGCWPDLINNPRVTVVMSGSAQLSVALLKAGMKSGLPSVAFRIELPNGQIVITETSLALLTQAIKVFNIHLEDRN